MSIENKFVFIIHKTILTFVYIVHNEKKRTNEIKVLRFPNKQLVKNNSHALLSLN